MDINSQIKISETMLLTFRIFGISALIGSLALYYGLIKRRGLKPTLIFLLWCTLFFLIKEYLTKSQWFNHIYYMQIPTKEIFEVPILIVFGWTFATCFSLEISRTVVDRLFPQKSPIVLTTLLSALVMSSVCHIIETMGVANNWWIWPPGYVGSIYDLILLDLNSFVPFGAWGTFSAVVVFPYLVSLKISKSPKWRHVPFYFIWAALFFLAFHHSLRPVYADNIIHIFFVFGAFLVPLQYESVRPEDLNTKGEREIIFAGLLMIATALILDAVAIIANGEPWTLFVAPISFAGFLLLWKNYKPMQSMAVFMLGVVCLGFLLGEFKLSFAPMWFLAFLFFIWLFKYCGYVSNIIGISRRQWNLAGYAFMVFLFLILAYKIGFNLQGFFPAEALPPFLPPAQ